MDKTGLYVNDKGLKRRKIRCQLMVISWLINYKSMDPYLFQDCPTFPLTREDTDWGDYPKDASNTSEDSDEDGYPVQRVSNIVEWNEYVFKDIEVPSTVIVDENPWCFQCSEAHWEHECPYSNGGHQQVNNIDHF
jgi:hypothetical protein